MTPTFEERYDEALAQSMLEHGHTGGGALPIYLGIELLRFAPGKLWCRATIRDELLTPFGTVHGGVVAGIIDHITGVVLYPLMPPKHWAATTEIKTNYIAPVQAGVLDTESTVARDDQPQRGGARRDLRRRPPRVRRPGHAHDRRSKAQVTSRKR